MKKLGNIVASSKSVGHDFTGTIRGFAKCLHTEKRMAILILVSDPRDEKHTKVIIEGLGECISMMRTTVREITDGMDTWKCLHCRGFLLSKKANKLLSRIPVK